jgi:hypothetical protein
VIAKCVHNPFELGAVTVRNRNLDLAGGVYVADRTLETPREVFAGLRRGEDFEGERDAGEC